MVIVDMFRNQKLELRIVIFTAIQSYEIEYQFYLIPNNNVKELTCNDEVSG